MHPLRRQRLLLVLFLVVVSSIAIGLVTYALRENINLFYTPSQVAAGAVPIEKRVRVGGMVVAGSVRRERTSLEVFFQLTDGAAVVNVRFAGILPDLFAEGQAGVATGKLNNQGIFMAEEVLAKHDENYTPPEVADAMQQAHERQNKADAGGATVNK